MRKKSWTLPEGFDGDDHDLEVIKKKLKENKKEEGQVVELKGDEK